jgi:hypothetical protein
LSGSSEALVDVEGVVNVRVVDQTLPSNGSPGLLKVAPHDDEKVILVLLLELQQTVAVLQCHGGVVDRARADHDHESPLLIHAVDDLYGLFTRVDDGFSGLVGLADLVLKDVWRGQGSHATDTPVLGAVLVADRLVGEEELRL